jgi:hypothetical protein
MPDDKPRDIADAMREEGAIDPEDLEDALYLALPDYIGKVRQADRSTVTEAMAPDDDEEDVEVGDEGEKVRVRSGKRTRRRWDYRRDFLTKKWPAGDSMVALGEMTPDDVKAVVAYYRTIAAENTAMARKFRALLDVFKSHDDAETVADLPEQEVREALPGE